MAGENWTFWLNMTNAALGVITVLALLVVLGAAGWEVWARMARKARATGALGGPLRAMLEAEPHSLSVPGLGLTMADGGERVEPSEAESSEEKPRRG